MATLRRLLEMSYLHCWGPKGSFELWQEWNGLYNSLRQEYKSLGKLLYLGGGEFKWEED